MRQLLASMLCAASLVIYSQSPAFAVQPKPRDPSGAHVVHKAAPAFGRPIPAVLGNPGHGTTFTVTGFYLVANEKAYGRALSTFKDAAAGSVEAALYAVAQSVINGDEVRFRQLSVIENLSDAPVQFKMFKVAAAKNKDPRVLHRFDIGDLSYFFLEGADSAPGMAIFLEKKGAGFVHHFTRIVDPISQVVVRVMEAMRQDSERFARKKLDDIEFSIPLVPAFGDKSANPAYVYIEGFKMNHLAFAPGLPGDAAPADASKEAAQVLRFYGQVFKLLEDKRYAEYVNQFEEYMRPRLTTQLEDKEFLEKLILMQVRPHYIPFMAVASKGCYVIFYQMERGPYEFPKPVFDRVLVDSEGTMRLSGHFDAISQLLTSDPFSQDFIKTCLTAAE